MWFRVPESNWNEFSTFLARTPRRACAKKMSGSKRRAYEEARNKFNTEKYTFRREDYTVTKSGVFKFIPPTIHYQHSMEVWNEQNRKYEDIVLSEDDPRTYTLWNRNEIDSNWFDRVMDTPIIV